jgi:hypothetical protein
LLGFITGTIPELDALACEVSESRRAVMFLLDNGHEMRPYDSTLFVSCTHFARDIRGLIDAANLRLTVTLSEFQTEVHQRTALFQKQIAKVASSIAHFHTTAELHKYPKLLTRAETLRAELEVMDKEAAEINAAEEQFGWRPTEFDALPTLRGELAPYLELWVAARYEDGTGVSLLC